jgi:NAD(P)-dependent dehydrogenase (short-subunit alcohol dehydrogenase family)
MSQPTRDDRLKDKVAIVTGGGSRTEGIGNGRAAAVLLARFGAKVVIVDRARAAAEATGMMIRAAGGTCLVFEGDVTDPSVCEAIVRETIQAWERLDVLVNNVGISGPPGTAIDFELAAWEEAMRVNVASMVLMAKYSIPEMRKNKSGSIINIASVAGLRGGNPNLFYPTSKGAVVQMTRAMAAQHGAEGIRVNCVAPGMVYTPMVSSRNIDPALREARINRSLLKTEGTGWDVGYAILYLASDEARWTTGVILPVDAGATSGSNDAATPAPDWPTEKRAY